MSIHEVAKRAGVSISTVSRTINGVRKVNPEIARRVWRAVDELGYHPNTQARALVSGRIRILGLIVSDITNPFFPEVIRGFEEVAVPAGFEVLLSSTNYDPARMASSVRRMLERKVEGVAIMTSEMEDSLIARLTDQEIPLVFLDVGTPGPHVSNIVVNYTTGIEQAIQHLLQFGHRRISFISGPNSLSSARIRREAFLACLEANEVEVATDLIIESDHTMEGGLHAVEKVLRVKRPPTAILASNDLTAIGLLRGLDRAGLHAPTDMSVVGFDDIRLAEFTLPPLTTIRLSRPELANLSFKALIGNIEGRIDTMRGATYHIDTSLIVRGSTGKQAGAQTKPKSAES
jgi:LacI family transcriptional regulator